MVKVAVTDTFIDFLKIHFLTSDLRQYTNLLQNLKNEQLHYSRDRSSW